MLYFSPVSVMAQYVPDEVFPDGVKNPVCFMDATLWPVKIYYLTSNFIFFFCPFIVLIKLYCKTSANLNQTLMSNVSLTTDNNNNLQSRRQVTAMLAVVIVVFFMCLLPFRVLQLWIIFIPETVFNVLGQTGFYSILYSFRILLYINSAVNPIIYNAVSSKFRTGFMSVIGLRSSKKDVLKIKRSITVATFTCVHDVNNTFSVRRASVLTL